MRITNIEDHARLSRLLEHVQGGFLENAVEIRRDGEPVAYLVDAGTFELSRRLADQFHQREPPFTQSALGKWMSSITIDLDDDGLPTARRGGNGG